VLQAYVSSVLDISEVCFICVFRMHVASVFIWMLHMFHTYVAYMFYRMLRMVKCFQMFFQVFQKHISSVSTAFRRMLQLLYLYVSKVDRVLHLSFPPSVASSWCVLPAPVGHPYNTTVGSFQIGGAVPLPLLSLGRREGLRGACEMVCSARASRHGSPSRCPGASTTAS
jgi:hypothetical protein